MWLRRPDLERMAVHAEHIGKGLLICQKFEDTCKDIVWWLKMILKATDEGVEFLGQEHRAYGDRLHSMLLGRALSTLDADADRFGVTPEQLRTLDRAKDARNWIVHESGLQAIYGSGEPGEQAFTCAVLQVARGDFLVSRWSYEFHEKESGTKDEQEYVNTIRQWLWSPLECP